MQPGRFNEANYCNARSRLYLYQRRKGEWAISSRRGGSSSRASCKAGALTGTLVWSLFDGQQWTEASLDVVDGSAEELASGQLAEAVVVASRYDNIAGLYQLRGEGVDDSAGLKCAVGQYYNVEDDKVLWHNARHEQGAWMISDPGGVLGADPAAPNAYKNYAVCEGGTAASLSPEDADWTKAQLTLYRTSAVEGRIRAEEDEQGQWSDPSFPPSAVSVGEGLKLSKGTKAEQLRWVRAPALLPHGELPQLFNRIEPDDILQGALGDCWLLAAIAAVAEFPDYISDQLFVTKTIDGEDMPGKYRLRLFDVRRGRILT